MAGIVKDRSRPALVTPTRRAQAEAMSQTTFRLRADALKDRISP